MMDATAPTPLLEIQQAVVTRDGQAILKIPQLSVERGEVLAVIGPNGAGKSTLLLAISQLLPLSAGRLLLNGGQITPAQSLAYRRRLALVLQEPLLLNTSVFENIATGLHFRGVPRAEIQHTVQHWLNRLGITHLKNRPARKLSGGEAQRVSLARALALQPDLLLLDEPFSALDTPTRLQLHQDLAQLLGETHTTAIFVTHDMDEALYLGTRVAILIRGELRQVGSPEEVFTAPKDPEVAQFVGVETVFPGRVISQEEGLITAEINGLLVQAVSTAAVGRTLMFCLRPEDITLSPLEPAAANSARNRMTGRIARLTASGALLRVELEGAVRMVALITRSSAREMGLSEGQLISAAFKASAVHTIEKI